MKKIIAFVLGIICCISLAACGNKDKVNLPSSNYEKVQFAFNGVESSLNSSNSSKKLEANMRPNVVINVQEPAEACEKAQLWIEKYEKISSVQVEKQEICRKLIERVKKAAELCESCKGDINEPIFDGEFPLGDEKDAMFAAKFFTVAQMTLMQTGLADKVPRGYYVEPAYDVLIRNGFLAELEGDYQSALNCYDGVPLPDYALKERMDLCRQRMKRCVSHPDKRAVDVCTSCGRPICKECKDTQQIYSRSDEMGLPYCKECYAKSVDYLQKHGR